MFIYMAFAMMDNKVDAAFTKNSVHQKDANIWAVYIPWYNKLNKNWEYIKEILKAVATFLKKVWFKNY